MKKAYIIRRLCPTVQNLRLLIMVHSVMLHIRHLDLVTAKSYQMDPANGEEALREVEQDIKEGADLIIAKPAMAYLDVLKDISIHYNIPIVAYNVSGEYAMVKAAAQKGWLRKNEL